MGVDPLHWMPPLLIKRERELGWKNFHPEDYCHRCGVRNMLWFAKREDWLTATSAWAAETGREGICCPQCFAEMHDAATGDNRTWRLSAFDSVHDAPAVTRKQIMDEAVEEIKALMYDPLTTYERWQNSGLLAAAQALINLRDGKNNG